jgi:Carbohydrate binding domain.
VSSLLNILIIAILAGVAVIQFKTYQLVKKIMAFDATQFSAVLDALETALNAEASEAATIAQLQAQNATLQQSIAALNDPVLQQRVTDLLAKAAAANPPPAIPAFDPTKTYAAGDKVTDATGAIWQAVTPVVGEIPGAVVGNWTLITPAPASS